MQCNKRQLNFGWTLNDIAKFRGKPSIINRPSLQILTTTNHAFQHCVTSQEVTSKIFGQTLRFTWQIRLSVVCDVRAHSGSLTFNFSRIFLHHIVACMTIRQLTHQKSRRSSKGITPPRWLNRKRVVKQANLAYRSRYLFIIQLFIYRWSINK